MPATTLRSKSFITKAISLPEIRLEDTITADEARRISQAVCLNYNQKREVYTRIRETAQEGGRFIVLEGTDSLGKLYRKEVETEGFIFVDNNDGTFKIRW